MMVPFDPPYLLIFGEALGYPPTANLPQPRMIFQYVYRCRRSDLQGRLDVYVGHPAVLSHHGFRSCDAFFGNRCGRTTDSLFIFQGLPASFKFAKPAVDHCFRRSRVWESFPKEFQRISLTDTGLIIIENHRPTMLTRDLHLD